MKNKTAIIFIPALCMIALGMFALGTKKRASTSGGLCEATSHWWFGWWVRCVGGERCEGEICTLQWRRKGTEDHWADTGVVPGGSVAWSKDMEYRCVCG